MTNSKLRPPAARLLPLALLSLLAACGGDGGGEEPAPPPAPAPAPTPSPFAAVDSAAATAFAGAAIGGMGIAIYDGDGRKLFEKMYGDFAPDRRIAVASASKLVSGVTLFRLIEQGFLSLDSTTGTVLGWTGPQAAITLRQLLSFTSGLPPAASCTSQSGITLAACVQQISQLSLIAAPGTRFDYGSTHLHVAARMAEVVTGSNWNAIFAQQLGAPLGLSAENTYYTFPRQVIGTSNPLIAGGMRTTMNDYARLLELVYRRGSYGGNQLIQTALFDAQAREPFPNVTIGGTPLPGTRYGLTAWLECSTPATGCAVISSAGAFGFMPWVDRDVGYYAIIGMEDSSNDGERIGEFSFNLANQLEPLIRTALGR